MWGLPLASLWVSPLRGGHVSRKQQENGNCILCPVEDLSCNTAGTLSWPPRCLCHLSFFIPQSLCLRQNLIKCIENLEELQSLRELDLYDNQIKKIENLEALTQLE